MDDKHHNIKHECLYKACVLLCAVFAASSVQLKYCARHHTVVTSVPGALSLLYLLIACWHAIP